MDRRDFLLRLAAAVSAPLGASMGASLPPLPPVRPDRAAFIESCRFVQVGIVRAFAIPPLLLRGS